MRVGDYELLEPRGRGASGTLYRAEHVEREGVVAIKELVLAGQSDWTPMERFEREAKALASLDHPGIVRFIEAFEAEGERGPALYIVSDFVDGPTLGEQIDEGRRWNEAEARALLTTLLQTLDYLHTLSPRVVHRDIKPGNIVMRDGTDPVLIDFGAVVDAAPRGDGGLTVAGTAGYMAPEQAMGARDPRSDLYGVGATIVHALTHVHPIELVEDGLRINLPDRIGASKGFVAILERLLEPSPSDRFATAAEALAALEDPEQIAKRPSKALAVRSTTALATVPRTVTPAVAKSLSLSRAMTSLSVGAWTLWAVSVPALAAAGVMLLPPLIGIVLSTLGIIALLLGLGLARRGRDQSLYRHGTAIVGTVRSVETGGNQAITVRYSYDAGGRTHDGRLVTRNLAGVRELERGSEITVLHDPDDPSASLALLPDEAADFAPEGV